MAEVDSRPPHGGRGLKSLVQSIQRRLFLSAPTRGPWIEILNKNVHIL